MFIIINDACIWCHFKGGEEEEEEDNIYVTTSMIVVKSYRIAS